MSKRIELDIVVSMLNLPKLELMEKLLEWNQEIPFKIDDQLLVVEDLDLFSSAINIKISPKPDNDKKNEEHQ